MFSKGNLSVRPATARHLHQQFLCRRGLRLAPLGLLSPSVTEIGCQRRCFASTKLSPGGLDWFVRHCFYSIYRLFINLTVGWPTPGTDDPTQLQIAACQIATRDAAAASWRLVSSCAATREAELLICRGRRGRPNDRPTDRPRPPRRWSVRSGRADESPFTWDVVVIKCPKRNHGKIREWNYADRRVAGCGCSSRTGRGARSGCWAANSAVDQCPVRITRVQSQEAGKCIAALFHLNFNGLFPF